MNLYYTSKDNRLTIGEFFASDLPGYNHLDVLIAAADRPSHRRNEVFEPMMNFVFSHSGGRTTPND